MSTTNEPPVVHVFGPVEVVGADRPFRRAFALDLVAYLALHPHGVTTDRWVTALWPERSVAPATVHSTSSAARRSLGRDAAGRDFLPSGHGRLALDRRVRCDLDLAEAALADGAAACRPLLGLLRGRAFDGLQRFEWVIAEGHLARAERVGGALAALVATEDLAAGHLDAAHAALRRGIAVSPYDEGLWRLLLEVTSASGSRRSLDAVIAELGVLLGATTAGRAPAMEEVEYLVHPTTWARYCTLASDGGGDPRTSCLG